MSTSSIAPTALIDPAANLNESTVVGPEAHIGPQVKTGLNVRIGAYTRILGPVVIDHGVAIGSSCTLIGPLLIQQDVVIEDGAALGVVVASGSLLERGVLHTGARIGAKAEVLGLLSVGEYARVQPGARLEGDLPHHALASGKPAGLVTFVCACGQEYRSVRRMGDVFLMRCPVCSSDYRIGVTDLQRRGRFLLPNHQAGEAVPTWRQAG